MNKSNKNTDKHIKVVERRYEICRNAVNSTENQYTTLEKKAQFLFSILSLFISGIFLKLDYLTGLIGQGKSYNQKNVFTVVIISFFVLFMVSLIFLLLSFALRKYKSDFPDEITQKLFLPSTNFYDQNSDVDLVDKISITMAISVDNNLKVNSKKANCIIISWMFLLLSLIVFVLMVFLVILFNLPRNQV